MKIFADDTKVYNEIKEDRNVEQLQCAIDSMFDWTQKWLLKFNKEKCKILHLGRNNPQNKYLIGKGDQRIPLEVTELEKDLGVHVDPNLNFKNHVKTIVKKASYSSYKILKNFTFREANILIPIFKSMVRPILEYGNVVWSNGLKKHMTKIENVQRKFTKHVKGIHNLSYENRLKKLKLPSLEYRQARGDMIEVFKIIRNYYDYFSTQSLFKLKHSNRLRGHDYTICKQAINKSKY